MNLWKSPAKRDKARKLYSFIHSSLPDKNSWPMDRVLSIAIREFCYLSSHEQLKKIGDDTLYGFPVAITNIFNPSLATLDDFEQEFWRHVQAKPQQKESVLWKFYMPFYVERKDDVPRPTRIRILDVDCWLLPLSTVLKQVPATDFMRRATFEHFAGRRQNVEAPELYLVMAGGGPSWNRAWEQITPAFDTLRGLIEFTFGFGGWHYGSHQEPRRKVPHPWWLVALCPGRADTFTDVDFLVDPYHQTKKLEITAERFSVLRKNAGIFRTTPTEGSTVGLIARSLRLYAQALDARLAHHCVTGLWQVAESITLAEDSGGKTQDVVNRLAWHTAGLGPEGVELDELLSDLATKRNDIVHNGVHNVGDEDINTLKLMCELGMRWLFRSYSDLPTIQHVREYYTYRTLGQKDLAKTIARGQIVDQVVRYVEKQRN